MANQDDLCALERRLSQQYDEKLAHNISALAEGVSVILAAIMIQNLKHGTSCHDLADLVSGLAAKNQAATGERTAANDFLRMLAKMIRPESPQEARPAWTPIVLDGGRDQ
jgi:hypothetical protein